MSSGTTFYTVASANMQQKRHEPTPGGFRQCTMMDPLYGAAWRFLYDALIEQNKYPEAEAAAFGALAALPSAKPSWARVAHAMDRAGRKIGQFNWQPRASVSGSNIKIDPSGPEADGAAWLGYALAIVAAEEKGKQKLSPFERDIAAWRSALRIMSELGNDKIKDEGLRDMIRFNKGGQLPAAIFALHYKEAYRADFEAWKKSEPDGLKRFVETFRVGL